MALGRKVIFGLLCFVFAVTVADDDEAKFKDKHVFIGGPVDMTPIVPSFGPDIGSIYCAYCQQMGWYECIQRYCYGRFGAFFGIAGDPFAANRVLMYPYSALGAGSYGPYGKKYPPRPFGHMYNPDMFFMRKKKPYYD